MQDSNNAHFEQAVAHIGRSKLSSSNELKLEVYSHYKIATVDVTPQDAGLSRPGMLEFQGRAKYDAWVRYGTELRRTRPSASTQELQETARQRYIAIASDKFGFDASEAQSRPVEQTRVQKREKTVDELLDEDDEDDDEHGSSPQGSGGGMVSVSTMNMQEDDGKTDPHRAVDSIHELAATGDANGLRKTGLRGPELDALDQNGFAPIHLAADKGHLEVIKALLDMGADPNLPDSEGMTALETALAVEHKEIISILQNASESR